MYDYVRCCNCGFQGTVNVGTDKCPKCKYVGALSWVQGKEQMVEHKTSNEEPK
jgi:ssDNA-binding Zn-finger/Zn-ribbon topoisomerase 1